MFGFLTARRVRARVLECSSARGRVLECSSARVFVVECSSARARVVLVSCSMYLVAQTAAAQQVSVDHDSLL